MSEVTESTTEAKPPFWHRHPWLPFAVGVGIVFVGLGLGLGLALGSGGQSLSYKDGYAYGQQQTFAIDSDQAVLNMSDLVGGGCDSAWSTQQPYGDTKADWVQGCMDGALAEYDSIDHPGASS